MSFADAVETPLKVCQELDAILVGRYISFNLISVYRPRNPSNYKCITLCVYTYTLQKFKRRMFKRAERNGEKLRYETKIICDRTHSIDGVEISKFKCEPTR